MTVASAGHLILRSQIWRSCQLCSAIYTRYYVIDSVPSFSKNSRKTLWVVMIRSFVIGSRYSFLLHFISFSIRRELKKILSAVRKE